MSIWTVIFKEIVKDAIRDALAQELGPIVAAIAEIIDDPEAAAEAIIDNKTEKENIKLSLTNIFRAILRVFK